MLPFTHSRTDGEQIKVPQRAGSGPSASSEHGRKAQSPVAAVTLLPALLLASSSSSSSQGGAAACRTPGTGTPTPPRGIQLGHPRASPKRVRGWDWEQHPGQKRPPRCSGAEPRALGRDGVYHPQHCTLPSANKPTSPHRVASNTHKGRTLCSSEVGKLRHGPTRARKWGARCRRRPSREERAATRRLRRETTAKKANTSRAAEPARTFLGAGTALGPDAAGCAGLISASSEGFLRTGRPASASSPRRLRQRLPVPWQDARGGLGHPRLTAAKNTPESSACRWRGLEGTGRCPGRCWQLPAALIRAGEAGGAAGAALGAPAGSPAAAGRRRAPGYRCQPRVRCWYGGAAAALPREGSSPRG